MGGECKHIDSFYMRSKNMWDSLDTLAAKAMSVFLGAFIVTVIEDFRVHPVEFSWTFMIMSVIACPPLALFLDTYGKLPEDNFIGSRLFNDVRYLLTKTSIQILAWAIKKWVSGPAFDWGSSVVYDCSGCLCFLAFYFVLNFLVQWAGLRRGSGPPFVDGRILCGVRQIVEGYILIVVGALPTSIGYVVNRMYLSFKPMGIEFVPVLNKSPMLIYVLYFFIVGQISIMALSFPHCIGGDKKPTSSDYNLLAVVSEDGALAKRVGRIETMLSGCDVEPPKAEPVQPRVDPMSFKPTSVPVAARKAWKEFLKHTIKFSFAWAGYYLAKDFIFRFLGGCDMRPEDSSKHCDIELHFYFALSLLLSFSVYMPAISIVQPEFATDPRKVTWFGIQRTAIPVMVGWSWNLYVGRLAANTEQVDAFFMLCAALLVTSLFYNTYMSISRDLRLPKLDEFDPAPAEDVERPRAASSSRRK